MSGLKYFCAIALIVGTSSAAQAFTLTSGDARAETDALGNVLDLEVNVGGAGGEHLDHLDKESIYLNENHVSALGGGSSNQAGPDEADYSFSDGDTSVDIHYSLSSGGAFEVDIHKDITVTSVSGGSFSLVVVDDKSLTRKANGTFDPGASTENAVFSGSGNQTVTQTEIGDNAGFLISQAITTLSAQEDLNRNGSVDDPDLAAFLQVFGTTTTGGPAAGDFNNNGAVDDPDLARLLAVFGTKTVSHWEAVSDGSSEAQAQSPADLRDSSSTAAGPNNTGDDINSAFQVDFTLNPGQSRTFNVWQTITPEPASLALLGLGATLLAARRSRRS
jgi:hypothetical protein